MSVPVGERVALGKLAKAAPVDRAAPARSVRHLFSGTIPAWLQVAPFAAVNTTRLPRVSAGLAGTTVSAP